MEPYERYSEIFPHQEALGESSISCQTLKGISSRFIVIHIFLSLTKFSKAYASALSDICNLKHYVHLPLVGYMSVARGKIENCLLVTYSPVKPGFQKERKIIFYFPLF